MKHYTQDRTLSRKIENYLDGIGGSDAGAIRYSALSKDAFGRVRVSEPFTLFDSSHINGDNGLWFNEGDGAISVQAQESTITLDADPGESLIRETKRVFPYQPGKSLLILNSYVFDPTDDPEISQRVGFYDNTAGVFIEKEGSPVSFKLRNGLSDIFTVPQEQWNVDRMDGTGPSQVTLDHTKAQIFWIDLEWLGVGSVRCGFIIDGIFILSHVFHHANSVDTTYMPKAVLPIRYEVAAGGAASSSVALKQICSTVLSEGGYEPVGQRFYIQDGTVVTATQKSVTTAGTFYNGISVRLDPNKLDAVVIPSDMSILGTSNTVYQWSLLLNANVTLTNWSSLSGTPVQYSTDISSVTGGTILKSGFFTSDSGSITLGNIAEKALQITRSSTTISDVFTLAVTSASPSSKFATILGFNKIVG